MTDLRNPRCGLPRESASSPPTEVLRAPSEPHKERREGTVLLGERGTRPSSIVQTGLGIAQEALAEVLPPTLILCPEA